ncbi:hypothetical protein ACFLY6_02255 [Candidatus Dependentiae bacterium]
MFSSMLHVVYGRRCDANEAIHEMYCRTKNAIKSALSVDDRYERDTKINKALAHYRAFLDVVDIFVDDNRKDFLVNKVLKDARREFKRARFIRRAVVVTLSASSVVGLGFWWKKRSRSGSQSIETGAGLQHYRKTLLENAGFKPSEKLDDVEFDLSSGYKATVRRPVGILQSGGINCGFYALINAALDINGEWDKPQKLKEAKNCLSEMIDKDPNKGAGVGLHSSSTLALFATKFKFLRERLTVGGFQSYIDGNKNFFNGGGSREDRQKWLEYKNSLKPEVGILVSGGHKYDDVMGHFFNNPGNCSYFFAQEDRHWVVRKTSRRDKNITIDYLDSGEYTRKNIERVEGKVGLVSNSDDSFTKDLNEYINKRLNEKQ